MIAEIARRGGLDIGVLTTPMAFAQLVEAVPFYRGLTLEEIGGPRRALAGPRGGVGVPGQRDDDPRDVRAADRSPRPRARARAGSSRSGSTNGALRLGTYRSIWAAPEVEISPALKFTVARQQVELSPEDARRLGIGNGEAVEVSQNGTALRGRRRTSAPASRRARRSWPTGIAEESANAFTEPVVEVAQA